MEFLTRDCFVAVAPRNDNNKYEKESFAKSALDDYQHHGDFFHAGLDRGRILLNEYKLHFFIIPA